MSVRSLLARAIVSAAVVGVAIAVPVTGAGAATNDSSTASVGISADLGAHPVVAIGGTPASGTGVVATAPVDGHIGTSVRTSTVRSTTAPLAGTAGSAVHATGTASVVGSANRVADADVRVDACIAAALLDGRAPTGC